MASTRAAGHLRPPSPDQIEAYAARVGWQLTADEVRLYTASGTAVRGGRLRFLPRGPVGRLLEGTAGRVAS